MAEIDKNLFEKVMVCLSRAKWAEVPYDPDQLRMAHNAIKLKDDMVIRVIELLEQGMADEAEETPKGCPHTETIEADGFGTDRKKICADCGEEVES